MKKLLLILLLAGIIQTSHASKKPPVDTLGFKLELSLTTMALEGARDGALFTANKTYNGLCYAKSSTISSVPLVIKFVVDTYNQTYYWLYPEPIPPFPIEQAATALGHDTISAALHTPFRNEDDDSPLSPSFMEALAYLIRK